MQDKYGAVDVYMLPFIKPAHVRRFCDDEIITYTDAINSVISKLSINHDNRNILVTHQFVTGSLRSESEEISVGGSDNVDAYVFYPFDYVALGHIHSPQNCGTEHIRYCGTPLKYSFSEAKAMPASIRFPSLLIRMQSWLTTRISEILPSSMSGDNLE